MRPTIVWLHGLGDSGRGWSHLRSELNLTGVEYAFPDAPTNPVTCNGGFRMTSWMDLENIPVSIGDKNDLAGVKASAELVHATLDAVVAKGTPSSEIVLGGFSQGGAMALYAGYTYPKPLAGVVIFSGWAPLTKPDELGFIGAVKEGANVNTPAFVAHGAPPAPHPSSCRAARRHQGRGCHLVCATSSTSSCVPPRLCHLVCATSVPPRLTPSPRCAQAPRTRLCCHSAASAPPRPWRRPACPTSPSRPTRWRTRRTRRR
eukprot:1054550-Prymnesium_polylepis.1